MGRGGAQLALNDRLILVPDDMRVDVIMFHRAAEIPGDHPRL